MSILRNLIFKKLFSREFDLINYYQGEISHLDGKVRMLNNEIQEYKAYKNEMINIFMAGREIIGVEKNKRDQTLFVVKDDFGSSMDIHLYGLSYGHSHPILSGITHENYTTGEKTLEITDVQMIDNSIGNGTIVMKYLLKTAKKNKISRIYGLLSSVDKDNFERSVPYYKKFGFDVKLNDKENSGHISLII